MKALKRLLVALILLIVLTTIILWVFARSVDSESIKNYVSAELSTLTKQNSKIEGEIAWHLLPQPGIKITHITIGDENNPSGLAVNIDNLLFNLKITPLFRGKFVFNEINIDGFRVNIHTNSPTRIANTQQPEKHAENKQTEEFAIERLLLSHGQINFIQNQKTISFLNLQLGAEQINLQQKLFPLQLKTKVEISEGNNKILKTYLSFKGSSSFSPAWFTNQLVALDNMSIDGQLAMQNLKFNHFKINTINAHLKNKPGVLQLDPLTIKMYKGESIGNLKYEYPRKKLILNQTATNINSAKLFQDLFKKSLVRGSLDFSIHSQTSTESPNWLENTTGQGSLTIKEGLIETINLDRVVEVTSDKINGLLATKIKQILQLDQFTNSDIFQGNTQFKLLTFQYFLQSAKLESNSLVLQTDKLQLKGDGVLYLNNNNNLDSHLFAKIITTNEQINNIQQLLGGSFPILIHGSLTEPSVQPDLQKINPVLTQEWVKNTLTKPVKLPVKLIDQTLKTIIDKKE